MRERQTKLQLKVRTLRLKPHPLKLLQQKQKIHTQHQLQRRNPKLLNLQLKEKQLHQRLLRKLLPPMKQPAHPVPNQVLSQNPILKQLLLPLTLKKLPVLLSQKEKRRSKQKKKQRMKDYQITRPKHWTKRDLRMKLPRQLLQRQRNQSQKRRRKVASICYWRECSSSLEQSRLPLTQYFLDTSQSWSHFLLTESREC